MRAPMPSQTELAAAHDRLPPHKFPVVPTVLEEQMRESPKVAAFVHPNSAHEEVLEEKESDTCELKSGKEDTVSIIRYTIIWSKINKNEPLR